VRSALVVWSLGSLVVACGPAGAAPSWSVTASPHPSGATASELDGVACTNPTNCFAVGNYYTSSGKLRTLVERMSGTSWSVIPGASPKGAVTSRLDGVSCPTASFCAAVGTWSNGTAQLTLVAHWNGKAWAVAASPNPSVSYGSDNRLYGVSCASASNCFAVGTAASNGPLRTLVERWDGKKWAIVASPNPKGATHSSLLAVSCAGASNCSATGFWYVRPRADGGTTTTLVERWNGAAASVVTSPNPKNADNSTLGGVSCPSLAKCVAVGQYEPPGKTLTERLNGQSWSVIPTPNPLGASSSFLDAVSCSSATRCFAAGGFRKAGVGSTLIERYDGTKWSVAYTANPGFESILRGVSCPTTQFCIAVGTAAAQTLVERYA
jgi:hypothetical protein